MPVQDVSLPENTQKKATPSGAAIAMGAKTKLIWHDNGIALTAQARPYQLEVVHAGTDGTADGLTCGVQPKGDIRRALRIVQCYLTGRQLPGADLRDREPGLDLHGEVIPKAVGPPFR